MKDRIYQSELVKKAQWDEAKWRGTAFFFDRFDEEPPILGLIFMNKRAGIRIFNGWLKVLGEIDEHEALRVVIVDGDIPNEEPGYSVIIGSNPSAVEHAEEEELDSRYIATENRIFRNPNPNSPNRIKFKSAYEKHGQYILIPVYSPDLKQLIPLLQYGIRKREMNFRRVEDISETDIDSVVFSRSRLFPNRN